MQIICLKHSDLCVKSFEGMCQVAEERSGRGEMGMLRDRVLDRTELETESSCFGHSLLVRMYRSCDFIGGSSLFRLL